MAMNCEQHDGNARTLVCPICSQPFTCELSSSCWCASKTIPAPVSDYLSARYETCICSTCLDRLIAEGVAGGRP
jgi:hypothetical protein